MGRSKKLLVLAFLFAVGGCASGGHDPYGKAVELYGRGQISESVREYQHAIMASPSDPLPRFNLAVIYQDQGRLDEAEKLYRSIVAEHPEFAAAWSNLASIQEKRGDAGSAEQSYRRGLEANRDDPWAASQFGYFFFRLGRLDEAGVLFEESLRRNPKCANAWFGLGEIAEKRGDIRTALQSYDRTILYNPSDLPAIVRAAELRARNDDRKGAISLLRKALKIDPKRGDIQFQLGKLLSEDGRWKDAEKAFELARESGVSHTTCDRELSTIYGRLCEEAAASAACGEPAGEESK